jgi:tryptophan halogenase
LTVQATVNPIRQIVIVGGGTAGWMSATLLSKLGKATADSAPSIRLIESEEIGTIGVGEATIPAIKVFNQLVELDEVAFIKATKGTFKLGIEFVDWGKVGTSYMHGFGKIGQELGWLRMHQYWLKMRSTGKVSTDFADYSINTAAAFDHRFMRPRPDMPASPLREIAYAYHFDAGLYAQFLRTMAEANGVQRTEGKIAATRLRPSDGFVESVVLESGEIVKGDLFIDCSGMRGLLIEQALKTGFEDWSQWLVCDSALAVPCANGPDLLPYTRSTARAAGWQWRIPLQHRIGNGHVFASQFMGQDEACDILMANLDGAPLADPRPIRFTPGKRKKLWNKNVIAVGLSGGFLEPLESTSIHLIQTTLLRLIALYPDLDFKQANIDAFNRQAEFEYTRIRDFIIAHYKVSERDDSPMWRYCRDMEIPDSLRHKLDIFGAQGRVFKEADELFAEESWIQVLLGQGVNPQAYDPFVDLRSKDEITNYLNNISTVVKRCVAVMPKHADYLAQFFETDDH